MPEALIKREDLSEHIAVLFLNDPDSRNAMSEAMAVEFRAAVKALGEESRVRAVILRGSGKAFSGGGHLDMLADKMEIPQDKNRALMMDFYDNFLSIQHLDVPVIAAINGHAVGAGLCVAMACDFRIAKRGAKLGVNFVRLGLHPGMGASYFLPRLVGPAHAAELLYSGKIFDVDYGASIGLINEVVDESEFEQRIHDAAQAIAESGPESVQQLKQSLVLSPTRSLQACLEREAECQSVNYASAEFREGVTAAKEKRKANFSS